MLWIFQSQQRIGSGTRRNLCSIVAAGRVQNEPGIPQDKEAVGSEPFCSRSCTWGMEIPEAQTAERRACYSLGLAHRWVCLANSLIIHATHLERAAIDGQFFYSFLQQCASPANKGHGGELASMMDSDIRFPSIWGLDDAAIRYSILLPGSRWRRLKCRG